ncbi:uncharacterized protein TNCV_3736371 [Trichonephila clavipes]|nr:uncharacterized protein TNCV_3736371 [Trichonephila clavipes]
MRLIERQLQTAVTNIIKWCDNNGHSISASKSSCVHFCRKRGIHPDPEIRIRDIQIPVVPDVRFLGVIFDRRLTFLPHILHLRKRCEKSLNLLKVLSNTSWGADRTSLLRVYQAIVLSRIDYGCVAYGSACNSTLQKLDPVHHMALRICSGAFRTSPVQSLYVCHQLPLDLRRRKLSLAFYFKILSVPSHPLQNVYMSTSMKRLYDARPSNIRPFMDRMKLHISELDLPNVPPVVFQRVFAYHRSQYSHYSAVYTDGSKRADYVGCGVVIEDIMHGYRLDTSCSIFTAEAVAIYRALQLIDSTMPRKYCIYTDSMSVLEALENYHDRCHPVVCTILDITSRLYSKGFDIVFCWLPSHVGIIGNEQADSAAKSATTHLPLAVPLSDMKRVIMHHIFKIWQESRSPQLDNKLHSVKPVIGAWPVMPLRRTDVKLTRLRIGHTRFTHRHLLFGECAPECPSCHVSYTVHHILIDCPVFNNYRITFFNSSHLTLPDLAEILNPLKKLRSGDLLIETLSALQTKSFLLAKTFLDCPLTVSPHKSLNSSRGVISEPDLICTPETEILEEFSGQGVIQVRRITIKKDAEILPTKHLILTFNNPKLPTTIKAGCLNCKIRPYVPNPLRCFKCQRFGHSHTACRGQLTCSRCATVGHPSTDCTLEPRCVNCSQSHPSDSKLCSQWKTEKEIQIIKTNRNLTYLEARKLIAPQLSQSYAQVTKLSTTTTTTQTDENITKIVCPPLKLLQPLVSVPKPTISSSVAAVNKSSTSTQAELVPSTSLVTVASPSISQPPNSVIDTAPTTSNSLSISAASSSSTACSVLETTTTISNTIPATSQDTNQTSKPRRKKRPPKNQSNTVKPKIEIKTAPHKPRKSGPTEYTTDEEDMIIYDVEDEPEPNPKYVLNMNGFTYKGELINKPFLICAKPFYNAQSRFIFSDSPDSPEKGCCSFKCLSAML